MNSDRDYYSLLSNTSEDLVRVRTLGATPPQMDQIHANPLDWPWGNFIWTSVGHLRAIYTLRKYCLPSGWPWGL